MTSPVTSPAAGRLRQKQKERTRPGGHSAPYRARIPRVPARLTSHNENNLDWPVGHVVRRRASFTWRVDRAVSVRGRQVTSSLRHVAKRRCVSFFTRARLARELLSSRPYCSRQILRLEVIWQASLLSDPKPPSFSSVGGLPQGTDLCRCISFCPGTVEPAKYMNRMMMMMGGGGGGEGWGGELRQVLNVFSPSWGRRHLFFFRFLKAIALWNLLGSSSRMFHQGRYVLFWSRRAVRVPGSVEPAYRIKTPE